jgi:hypothetical protein
MKKLEGQTTHLSCVFGLVEDSVGDIECIGSRFSHTMCFNFNLLSSHSYSHVASTSSAAWHWVGSLVNGTRTVSPSEIVRESPTYFAVKKNRSVEGEKAM